LVISNSASVSAIIDKLHCNCGYDG